MENKKKNKVRKNFYLIHNKNSTICPVIREIGNKYDTEGILLLYWIITHLDNAAFSAPYELLRSRLASMNKNPCFSKEENQKRANYKLEIFEYLLNIKELFIIENGMIRYTQNEEIALITDKPEKYYKTNKH